MSTYYANDRYAAVLTAGYSVGQTTLYVSAVPNNVPTIIVAAKGTDNETVFAVTGKTTNSLTGVSRLRGANVDLDAQTPLTCLNNEEFINQLASVNAVFNEEHDETGKHTTDQINEKTEDAGVTVDGLKIKDGVGVYTDKAPNINVKARAYLSSDQENLISGSYNKVLLNAESYDVGGNFDITNHKFVAPVTGYYLVNGSVNWKSGSVVADKTYLVFIYVNGSTYSAKTIQPSFTGDLTATISDIVYLTAGQYVELYARHTAGVDTVDISGSSAGTYMSIHLLSI